VWVSGSLPRRPRPHPLWGWGKLASQKDANRVHAQLRSLAERANAQLKTWRILRKLPWCPWRRATGQSHPRPSSS
jgi:hypothetical protein